jgi:hypothetical protein
VKQRADYSVEVDLERVKLLFTDEPRFRLFQFICHRVELDAYVIYVFAALHHADPLYIYILIPERDLLLNSIRNSFILLRDCFLTGFSIVLFMIRFED